MNRQAQPAPVLRYLHRPLWWALGVAVFIVVQFAAHAREVYADSSTFATSVVAVADATPVDRDTGVIDLTYERADGTRVAAAVFARSYVDRGVQGALNVEVSGTDPLAVRLPGERRGYFDEMPYLLVLLLVPFASFVLRVRHIRRVNALMAAEEASYAMVAAAVPPGRLHPRWRLCLYPVDARPGAEPLCAVELIWLPVRPEGAFPVEVKGHPRPFGAVAVRTGDEILWPRGRALAVTSKTPRPALVAPFLSGAPDRLRFPAPSRPSLWPARLMRLAFLFALALYLWVGSGTSWRDEQALERSHPATATVVRTRDGAALGYETVVEYDRNGVRETATILLQSGAPPVGEPIRIRYDIVDPSNAWEASLRGPPDARGDLLLTLIMVAAGATFVASVLLRRQELAELGAYELAVDARVDMGTLPSSQ